MFKQKSKFVNFADERVAEANRKTNQQYKELINQIKRVQAAKETVDLWDNEAMKAKALKTFKQEKEQLLVRAGAYDGALFDLNRIYKKEKDNMSYTLHYNPNEWSDEVVFKALLDRM